MAVEIGFEGGEPGEQRPMGVAAWVLGREVVRQFAQVVDGSAGVVMFELHLPNGCGDHAAGAGALGFGFDTPDQREERNFLFFHMVEHFFGQVTGAGRDFEQSGIV